MLTRAWTSHVRPEWKVTSPAPQLGHRGDRGRRDGRRRSVAACLAGTATPSTSSSSATSGRSTSCAIASSATTRTPAIWRRTSSSAPIAALGSFKQQSSLGTWLYRIGVNVCLNKVGAAKRTDRTASPPTSDRLVEPRRKARPTRCFAASAPRRSARRSRGCRRSSAPRSSCACITSCRTSRSPAILGSSVGAVKANFFHALKNLKKLLSTIDDASLRFANSSTLLKARSAAGRVGSSRACAAAAQAADVRAVARGTRRPSTCPSRRRCSGIIFRRASERNRERAGASARSPWRRPIAALGAGRRRSRWSRSSPCANCPGRVAPAAPSTPSAVTRRCRARWTSEPPVDVRPNDAAWALLRRGRSDMELDEAQRGGPDRPTGAVDKAVLDLTPAERDAPGSLAPGRAEASGQHEEDRCEGLTIAVCGR